jgi:hypothetical protein
MVFFLMDISLDGGGRHVRNPAVDRLLQRSVSD